MLYKRYVDVIVLMNKEKQMKPLYIQWIENNHNRFYKVDKIYEVKRSSSIVGGGGIMYRCKIHDKEVKLFFEVNRWFIESQIA